VPKPSVVECSIPESSEIFNFIDSPTYSDCYITAVEVNTSATDAYRAVFGNVPSWISLLMSLRNKIAAAIGLRRYARSEMSEVFTRIHQVPYIVGSRAGIFPVLYVSERELILGDNDKHLDFCISVLVSDESIPQLYLSTIVAQHNFLGWLYMLVVKPIHRIIAPYVVRKAKAEGRL